MGGFVDPLILTGAGVAAMVGVQALDIAGHVVNHRKLKKAEKRLDEAEERGKRIEAALSGATSGDLSERMTDVRAAREAKADAAAAMEMALLAHLTERFGETYGPAIMEWVRQNGGDAWRRARSNPKAAQSILAPVIDMAGRLIAPAGEKQEERKDPLRSYFGA